MTALNTVYLNPATWDLDIDANGNVAMASPTYSVAQDVASVCKTWLGEVPYDTTLGIPYEQSILGYSPPLSLLASWYEQAALTVPGVTNAVCILQFDKEGRNLTGQIQLTVDNETINVSI